MTGVRLKGVLTSVTSGTSVPRTFIQLIAAANHRVYVRQMKIFYQGIVVTATPHVWRWSRQSDAGTTAAALPIVKVNAGDDETIQTTGAISFSSTEPTTGNVLDEFVVHTQNGIIENYADGDFVIKGGERVGLILLEAAAAADVTVTLTLEE